jgi:hypothetical protein
MPKFNIRAYAIDYFDVNVEAKDIEEAQQIFLDKQDAGDYEFDETVLIEGDEGFEVIDDLISAEE